MGGEVSIAAISAFNTPISLVEYTGSAAKEGQAKANSNKTTVIKSCSLFSISPLFYIYMMPYGDFSMIVLFVIRHFIIRPKISR